MMRGPSDESDETLWSALEAYIPDPAMGEFLRTHPGLLVIWAVTAAAAFYLYLAAGLASIGG